MITNKPMYYSRSGHTDIKGTSTTGTWHATHCHYYAKDHLGNTRSVVTRNSQGVISEVQKTHYYPFGGIIADISTGRSVQDKLYNGKELDTACNLWWYDFGAHQYDPAAPHFITPDPLAEKYYGWNMYGYCMNNPVRFIDTDGRKVQIPEKQYREKLVSYINNISSEIFAVNENGLLYNTGIKAESGKSQSYASRINDAIANEDLSIAIYIDQEFVNNGVIESISTRGEGITIKEDIKLLE